MSMRVRSVCGLVLCLLAGCTGAINVARVGAPRAPVPADSVRLFFSPDYVTQRYEPVAFLGTDVDWNGTYNDGIYRLLRRKAGQLGANAVIIVSSLTDAGGSSRIAGVRPDALRPGRGRAVAVHLVAAPPAP